MNNAHQAIAVRVNDHVTFDSDEGVQSGRVNDLRRDLGNGELHAWVELEHSWPGTFRAVPVAGILSAQSIHPPSDVVVGADWFADQYLVSNGPRFNVESERL